MDMQKLLSLANQICTAYEKEDSRLWSLSEGIKIQEMKKSKNNSEKFLRAVYEVCKTCAYGEPGEAEFVEQMKMVA